MICTKCVLHKIDSLVPRLWLLHAFAEFGAGGGVLTALDLLPDPICWLYLWVPWLANGLLVTDDLRGNDNERAGGAGSSSAGVRRFELKCCLLLQMSLTS